MQKVSLFKIKSFEKNDEKIDNGLIYKRHNVHITKSILLYNSLDIQKQ